MKRTIALTTALAASFTLLVAGTEATASPSLVASGTSEFSVTLVERFAGPNIVTRIATEGTFAGTFAGSVTGGLMEVVRASGDSRIHGFTTCVCTVGGRRGTVRFANVIAASLDPVTFDFRLRGRLVVVEATGGLEGLHAMLDVVFERGVTTYRGTYHFD